MHITRCSKRKAWTTAIRQATTPARQVTQDPYAPLRAWRREPLQTFFSTVWKPSASFGGSSRAGGDATGDAGLTGVAAPEAGACCFAASRARHPPPPPPRAPGRYLPAAGAGLSDLGGVSTPVRPDGTPERRQVFVSSRTGARAGAAAGAGACVDLRSACLRIAASSRSACRRAASIACWRSSSLALRWATLRSSSSRFFSSSAAWAAASSSALRSSSAIRSVNRQNQYLTSRAR